MPSADGYLAFQCFANLLSTGHLFAFFRMDTSVMSHYYRAVDLALQAHNKIIHHHLKELQIVESVYLFPWLQTCFLKCLPLSVASRVWDGFLMDGTSFLVRVALSLLDLLLPRDMIAMGAADFETVMRILMKQNIASVTEVW